MKLKNRFIRIAAAFAIVGIVALQIPARPSVSLAADGYRDTGGGLLTFKNAPTAVAAGVAIVALGRSVGSVGGTVKTGVGQQNIADITRDTDIFSDIASILTNSGLTENYRNSQLTVIWPTNDALKAALGETGLNNLKDPANTLAAATFIKSLTVSGTVDLGAAFASGQVLLDGNGNAVTLVQDPASKAVKYNTAEIVKTFVASNGKILQVNKMPVSNDL
nr:fasciclin domain-containing protein [Armatimonas sp.]